MSSMSVPPTGCSDRLSQRTAGCAQKRMEYGMLVIEDKAELPENVRTHIRS